MQDAGDVKVMLFSSVKTELQDLYCVVCVEAPMMKTVSGDGMTSFSPEQQ